MQLGLNVAKDYKCQFTNLVDTLCNFKVAVLTSNVIVPDDGWKRLTILNFSVRS